MPEAAVQDTLEQPLHVSADLDAVVAGLTTPSHTRACDRTVVDRAGGLSPFGEDTEFPLPAESLPYAHPHTVINR